MTEILVQGLRALGFSEAALAQAIPRLEAFARLLLEKNRVMNLTAITQPDQVATLHLLDSLAVWQGADLSGKALIDVGTGAGFPGLPLKIAHPDVRLTLLDSLGKRVDFLREVCAALSLGDVTCVHGRAEEYAADHREQYDAAVSRAVADLRVLAELCLPLVKVGGVFLSMKSTDSEAELAAATPAIHALGGRTERVVDYTIPTTEVTHRIIVIRKAAPTPARYPRRFAQIKKQPL